MAEHIQSSRSQTCQDQFVGFGIQTLVVAAGHTVARRRSGLCPKSYPPLEAHSSHTLERNITKVLRHEARSKHRQSTDLARMAVGIGFAPSLEAIRYSADSRCRPSKTRGNFSAVSHTTLHARQPNQANAKSACRHLETVISQTCKGYEGLIQAKLVTLRPSGKATAKATWRTKGLSTLEI